MKKPWPTPIPSWFWTWARWRLGRDEFKGHANDPKLRPKTAPDRIPYWAWAKLAVMLGKPVPKPPKPRPVDPALVKARDMLAWARGFTGSYKLGGGHGIPLVNVYRDQRLDCSSSSSLLLYHFGLLDSDYAHVSGWYETWDATGRGRYVTVHAAGDHMWVEFALPEGWWRFDTSPHGDGPSGPRVRASRRSDSRFVHRHPVGL